MKTNHEANPGLDLSHRLHGPARLRGGCLNRVSKLTATTGSAQGEQLMKYGGTVAQSVAETSHPLQSRAVLLTSDLKLS